ncbi:MAG: MFS transporter [Acidimicrobiia bacterium]
MNTNARPRLESTTFPPFARLALAYAIGVAGDVFVTVSLADTLFFSATTSQARPKVLLYLFLTLAPFAVVAPVFGPLIDRTRGGRRLTFAAAMAARAVLCLIMAAHVNGLALYPLAFGALVLSKTQSVTKSALVPTVIRHKGELVLVNSRLAFISILAGLVAGPVAALILHFGDAPWVLRTASLIFLVGTLAAFGLPRADKVARPETVGEREALHTRSILAAGSAMAVMRGVVGFFTFFAAFVLKSHGEPAWIYGLVLMMSMVGTAVGTILAPFLRRRTREEWILAGALVVPSIPLVFAARAYGREALVVAAVSVAAASAAGRLAFDSLVQRDGSDAVRGRAFARFETRFQLVWVLGGVLAVIFPGGGRSGIFLVALVLLFAGLSYVGAVRRPGPDERPKQNRAATGDPSD